MGGDRGEKIKVEISYEGSVWKEKRKDGLHLGEKHQQKLQEAGLC